MNLHIDELTHGIRHTGPQETGHAQSASLSSFALSKGAGAGAGRVQDVIAVDLDTSAFGSNAYAQRRRSTPELADTSVPGQMSDLDAMIVMSHTLSPEDYAKAIEDGYQPGDASCSESVTIMDRIKTAMLKAGEEIPGFTDSIDREKLAQITGSPAYASALEQSFAANDLPYEEETFKEAADAVKQAAELSEPDDAAVKYMVENRMDPTIRNFVLSEAATNGTNASAGGYYRQEGGYYALKADSPDLEKLSSQIDTLVEEAGYTTEEAGEEARWLLANDIPLTKENLQNVLALSKVTFPVDPALAADAAAAAIADGRSALDGNLADPESLSLKAMLLARSQEREEARLAMSIDANLQLLRKGIQIDTLPLEQRIDALQAARDEIAQRLFGDTRENPSSGELPQTDGNGQIPGVMTARAKLDLFEETLQSREIVRTAPADFIGSALTRIENGSFREISEEAVKASPFREMQAASSASDRFSGAGTEGNTPGAGVDARAAARALLTYEAVGTEVRADLGDSIGKAFRNVDELLREMDLEVNADNARAVRILGRNGMEISAASVEEIRTQDAKLRDVTDRLKPGAVLSMIRDGVNPMKMTLDELKQELDQRQQEGDAPAEKYARFLYRLEHRGDISDEERSSYIGIYRLFNNLKKTDHAAIGSVLQEGGAMTLGNLLGAMRTNRKAASGIDARVDDAFGGVEGKLRTPSISSQIEAAFTYYSARADYIYDHLDVDGLHAAQPTDDTTLPQLADAIASAEAEKAVRGTGAEPAEATELPGAAAGDAGESAAVPAEPWAQAQAQRIRDALDGAEAQQAAKELGETSLPVTPHFVEAMRALQAGRRKTDNLWDAMARLTDRASDPRMLQSAVQTIAEAVSDGERVEETYKEKTQEMMEDLDRMMEEAETAPELELMLLMKKQLTVASARADRNSYDLPVELDGALVNLHVTFEEKDGEGSLLTASVPTGEHGVLTLALVMGEEGTEGCLNTSLKEDRVEAAYLDSVREKFLEGSRDLLREADPESIRLFYGVPEGREQKPESRETISHETMFGLAKAFVDAVR